jgi:hypothetical protein
LLNEDEVKKRLRNANIIKLYEEFSKKTDLRIRFEQLKNEIRAENEYKDNSDEFIIRLRIARERVKGWNENDLAHELLHGEVMFIEKYGLISCERSICKLIRDYMEDIIIHSKLFKEFKIDPIEEEYISSRNSWAKELEKGEILQDKHWKEEGVIYEKLHKSLLYVQAHHLSYLLTTSDFDRFLSAFNKTYNGKKELEIALRIHRICLDNKWLNSRENYENALLELKNIDFLEIKEAQIKHYQKCKVGFKLT